MKKQKLFTYHADGTRPADFGTTATFSGSSTRDTLKRVASVYYSARITEKDKEWVAVAYSNKNKDRWKDFLDLMDKAGVQCKSDSFNPLSFHQESLMKFSSASYAKNACSTANAVIALGKKLISNTEASVIDPAYAGGGRVVKATSGGVTVSFLIPYSENAAQKQRDEEEKNAATNTKVAQEKNIQETADNESAKLRQETETLKAQTATSKTLRWIGIGTVAALVITAVIIIVIKVRKNKKG